MFLLFSICLYSAFYISAILIFKMADETKCKTQKKGIIIFGVIFISLFASLRDVNVGTDTANTVQLYLEEQYSKKLLFSSFSEFLHGNLLYYVISNIIHFCGLGTRTFLFILELCTVAPVAISAYKKRKQIPIHIVLSIFLLLYFQLSFNWMRQSAASAFILLTLINAQQKNIKQAVFTAIMAVLFHSSAIIGLFLLIYVYTFMRIKKKSRRCTFGICLMVLFLFLLTQWELIVSYGISSGILPSTYAGYLRVFSGQTTVESWFAVGIRTYGDFVIKIILVVIPFVFPRKRISTDEVRQLDFYKIMSVIGLIIYGYILLTMHSSYGNRISYSIEYIQLVNLGACYVRPTRGKGMIPLQNILIIGAVLLYNVWLYYILAWHDTVPFVFNF